VPPQRKERQRCGVAGAKSQSQQEALFYFFVTDDETTMDILFEYL
jgi:hypothetical protein